MFQSVAEEEFQRQEKTKKETETKKSGVAQILLEKRGVKRASKAKESEKQLPEEIYQPMEIKRVN